MTIGGASVTPNGQACYIASAPSITGIAAGQPVGYTDGVTNSFTAEGNGQKATHPACNLSGVATTVTTTGTTGTTQTGGYDTVNGRKRCSKDTNNGQNCPLYPGDFADGANIAIGGKTVTKSGQACYVEVVPSVANVAAGQPVGNTDGVANPYKAEAATARTRSACDLTGVSVVTASATTQTTTTPQTTTTSAPKPQATAVNVSNVVTKKVTPECSPGMTRETMCCGTTFGGYWACKSYISRVQCANMCDGYVFSENCWGQPCEGQILKDIEIPVGGVDGNPNVQLGGLWKKEGAGWVLVSGASIHGGAGWMVCINQEDYDCKLGDSGLPPNMGTGVWTPGAYAEYKG